MAKSTGLGRGFASLIPQDVSATALIEPGEKIQEIPLGKIAPNKNQPRTHFDESLLAELAESIKIHGVVQPIVVTQRDGTYEIVAGERRWRASKLAGKATVPTIVRSTQQLEQLEIALIENVQRVDLSPLEQAYSVQRLREQFNVSLESIAQRLGKAQSTVHNIVRLLQLPDEAKKALREHVITEGHARQILALKDDPAQQDKLLELILANGWSVRQTERYVVSLKEQPALAEKAAARTRTQTPETERLGQRLGREVFVRHTAKGGRLEIAFGDDDELQTLIDSLSLQ